MFSGSRVKQIGFKKNNEIIESPSYQKPSWHWHFSKFDNDLFQIMISNLECYYS